MKKIKIAIVGAGNCASSLIQGIEYYRNIDENSSFVAGIAHNSIKGYTIGDIECVAAFDIDKNKVGKDLSDAIFTFPNCTTKFCEVPHLGVIVSRGHVFDGLGENLKEVVPVNSSQDGVDVAKVLKESGAEILINYLPTGSQEATEFYAKQALIAQCALINAIPVFIASKKEWVEKFQNANLPLVGDDIKSQIGATIVHRAIVDLMVKRGVKIEKSYQINIGGNTDFYNLAELSRLDSKQISKNSALDCLIPYEHNVRVANPTYVGFQGDNKNTYITVRGKYFGDIPVSVDIKLDFEDSPNSAGVMVDVIRIVKTSLDKNNLDILGDISAFYFKHPLNQCDDNLTYQRVKQYIDN